MTDESPSRKKTRNVPPEIAARAEELRNLIRHHDRLYYVDDRPDISDGAYDELFKELVTLETHYPELRVPDSPTQRVGTAPASQLHKVAHEYPMLSLDSHVNVDDVRVFDQRVRKELEVNAVDYTVEPKYDGLSVELVYRGGRFERGATRGDGTVGEDVTANLRTIRTLPLQLSQAEDAPPHIVVRGEVYIPIEAFHQLNHRLTTDGEEAFANPRNAAAGALRQLDSRVTAARPLTLTCYDLKIVGEDRPPSHWEAVSQLEQWGLPIPRHRQRCASIDEVIAFHADIETQRDALPFEIDGVVVKVDRHQWQTQLGHKSRSPRWAIAFKFPPRKELTKVHDIVVSVGRTGALTPLALLNPVEIGGVTVSRASLHNVDEVARKDVRPGDLVKVERAGDVIPDVVERVPVEGETRAPSFTPPNACPVCHSPTRKDGPVLYCTGQMVCSAQLKGSLELFASKGAMNIDGLGKKTIAQLVDSKIVSDLADLYALTMEQLLALEGFAEKSATQLSDAIHASRQAPLARFLYGLGIPNVGSHVALILAKAFGSIGQLQQADEEELQQLPDVGPEIAGAVSRFFSDARNREILDRMQKLGVEVEVLATQPFASAQPLSGKVFVLTGTLSGYTRSEATERIQALGGRVTSSVSARTDYLVAGDAPGSKVDKAAALAVVILDEDAFSELLGQTHLEA